MNWSVAFGAQRVEPRWAGPPMRFFPDAQSLCRHVAKHLLTFPESLAWHLAYGALQELYVADDENGLWNLRRTIEQGLDPLPRVVEIYRAAVCEAWEDAERLGWIVTKSDVIVGFGSSAVLALAERDGREWCLRTAFLPGHGEPAAQHRLRRGRDERVTPYQPLHERLEARRAKEWNAEQRHFYLVFRVGVQAVRARHFHCSEWSGNEETCHYALLKTVLPSPSLKIDDWLEARKRCGRGS
ncbi:MAG: hypothetical protein J5I93_02710 [Pirellulaceae bacterium]|nr:hypothetical protein [Pirellulaceae bacterium]